MKDRIAQIMKSEQMTQQDFAAALDISPSTLSSIFNDRTQPSLTIVNKIHERFPGISLTWLLYGNGDMYEATDKEQPQPETASTPSTPENSPASQDNRPSGSTPSSSLGLFDGMPEKTGTPVTERVIEKVKYIDKPPRRITEINVYFDDGTYEVFVPRKKE